MADDAFLNPDSDPFKPPQVPVLVCCLHCNREYDSYLIEWRIEEDDDGKKMGFWCCPTRGCDGRGFGFDILPVDPDYHDERGGWVDCGDDEDDMEQFIAAEMESGMGTPFNAEEELEEILKEVEEKGDAPIEDDDEEWEGDKPF